MKREQILRMLANMDPGAMAQANEFLAMGEAIGVDVVTDPEPEPEPDPFETSDCAVACQAYAKGGRR
jgi:hypothetical protein